MSLATRIESLVIRVAQQRVAVVRASSDLKTAQYVDISCATTATSFDDSSEINLVVYR